MNKWEYFSIWPFQTIFSHSICYAHFWQAPMNPLNLPPYILRVVHKICRFVLGFFSLSPLPCVIACHINKCALFVSVFADPLSHLNQLQTAFFSLHEIGREKIEFKLQSVSNKRAHLLTVHAKWASVVTSVDWMRAKLCFSDPVSLNVLWQKYSYNLKIFLLQCKKEINSFSLSLFKLSEILQYHVENPKRHCWLTCVPNRF